LNERWTAREVAAASFFVLFLAVQFTVPLVKLWGPRAERFGWHMFAGIRPRPRFTLVMGDGTRKPANLAPYIGHNRGELSLGEALPPHLCRVVPDVVAVQIRARDSDQTRTYTCP
jgi:hypothetical protein